MRVPRAGAWGVCSIERGEDTGPIEHLFPRRFVALHPVETRLLQSCSLRRCKTRYFIGTTTTGSSLVH